MMRDGGRNMNRLFRNILKENKNDYIRTVLGCSWIISLIYFGSRERVSYSIWFIVIPADLTVERIHKKTSSYIQNINCIWNEKKA